MARIERMAAWFLSCLGAVLLGGSILVVPATAFADAGSDCYDQCGLNTECLGICCYDACAGDPTCIENCCADACGGGSCETACIGQKKNCNVVSCEGGCSLQKAPTCGDRKFDDIWCLKTEDAKQCNGCVCGDYKEYPGTCTCGLK